MSILLKFAKEFDERHDFDSADIEYLSKRHPRVEFENIPTAWVAIIDDLLISIKSNLIKNISQKFGQIIITTNKKPTKKQLSLIQHAESQIIDIDIDIFDRLGYSVQYEME